MIKHDAIFASIAAVLSIYLALLIIFPSVSATIDPIQEIPGVVHAQVVGTEPSQSEMTGNEIPEFSVLTLSLAICSAVVITFLIRKNANETN